MAESSGRRGTIGAWSARLDGEKWSELGWSTKSDMFGREKMGQRKERARMKNEVGFLKLLKRRGICIIAGNREKKRAGYKLIRALEFGFNLQFSHLKVVKAYDLKAFS